MRDWSDLPRKVRRATARSAAGAGSAASPVSGLSAGSIGALRRDLKRGEGLALRDRGRFQTVARFCPLSDEYQGVIIKQGDMRLVLSTEFGASYALQRLTPLSGWVAFAATGIGTTRDTVAPFLYRHGFVPDGVDLSEVDFDPARMFGVVFGDLSAAEVRQLRLADDA